MRDTSPSRRKFVAVAGIGALGALASLKTSFAEARNHPRHAVFALVQMRLPTKQSPRFIIQRMCQLMDECAVWSAKTDIIVFPDLENLMIAADSPEMNSLKNKARVLGTCLTFGCTLKTQDGSHEPAAIFVDPIADVTTRLEEHTAHILKQTYAISHTATHDHINHMRLPATAMDLFTSPMDFFEAVVR